MLLNMAEVNQVILLNEFNTFLSQLPQYTKSYVQIDLLKSWKLVILSERICALFV